MTSRETTKTRSSDRTIKSLAVNADPDFEAEKRREPEYEFSNGREFKSNRGKRHPYVPDITAPTITSAASRSVNENTRLSHPLSASEPVTWTIIGGADQAKFEISGGTLRWAADGRKDYDHPDDADLNGIYVVQVRATDAAANASDQTVTVTVDNVLESVAAPSLAVTSGASDDTPELEVTGDLAEDDVLRLQWDTVSSFDDDPQETTDTVDASEGTANLAAVAADEVADGLWYFRVRTERIDHLNSDWSNTASITIDSTAPVISSDDAFDIEENAQLAHALTANETVTWSIIGGVDELQFSLTGSTLTWVGDTAKNYEDPDDDGGDNTYVVQVRATDAAGNTADQTITVTVTNLEEPDAPTMAFNNVLNTQLIAILGDF